MTVGITLELKFRANVLSVEGNTVNITIGSEKEDVGVGRKSGEFDYLSE
jgi:hypothetical protein